MKNQYKQLKKLSQNIEGYYNKVTQTSYTAKDWSKDKKKIEGEMDSFEKQYKDLCQQINVGKESSDSRFRSTAQKIETDLDTYRRKILPYIEAIKEKAYYFSLSELRNPKEANEYLKVHLMLKDMKNKQELIQKRIKKSEEIHKTAAILKDTNNQMGFELVELDPQIDENETNVITSKESAEKAKQEITNPDEISRGNRKKMYCLIFIILVAICYFVFNNIK